MPYNIRFSPPTPATPRRRGSVLILVVALLVLLALVATAYLSTTRVDRYAARQYDSAVRLDLLLEGWKNVVFAATIDDLFDGDGNYRPSSIANHPDEPRDYENYDAPGVASYVVDTSTGSITTRAGEAFPVRHGDEWLSPRVPWLREPYEFVTGPNNQGRPLWTYISTSLLEDRFDTPYIDPATTATSPNMTRADPTFTVRHNVTIGSIELAQDGVGQVPFPAMTLLDPRTNRQATFIAADADGDGIADSGLQRLAEINGITYFAAYRVIDHNSAINVNTALASTSDFNGAGDIASDISTLRPGHQMVSGFFPSHVGMMEMLISYLPTPPGTPTLYNQNGPGAGNEFYLLNEHRFGFQVQPDEPRAVGIQGNGTALAYPPTEEGYGLFNRTDMWFNSVGEALWMSLGRRPLNPAMNVDPTPGTREPYKAFDVTASAALAYRNGVVLNNNSSRHELETILSTSLASTTGAGTVSTRPYRANNSANWFSENFALDTEESLVPSPTNPLKTPFHQRRPLLTATNATSNAVPTNTSGLNSPEQFTIPPQLSRYSGTPYSIGGPFNPRFEIDRSTEPNLPAFVGNLNDVHKRPATKVDINTASFGDMWRGFWNVMSYPDMKIGGVSRPFQGLNDAQGTPFTEATLEDLRRRTVLGSVVYDPYLGMKYIRPAQPPIAVNPNDPVLQNDFPLVTSNYWTTFLGGGDLARGFHPSRMFRSPIRSVPLTGELPNTTEYDENTFRMAADQVVLLRAAIAAVNAEQVRSRSDNLIVRTFVGYPREADALNAADSVGVDVPTKNNTRNYKEPAGNSFVVAGPPRAGIETGTGGAGLFNQPVTVRVFGTARQPFISEIYVSSDNQLSTNTIAIPPDDVNPRGYIAIEFFNPYPFAIDISKCRVLTVDRTPRDATLPVPIGLQVSDESQAALDDDKIVLDPLRAAGTLAAPMASNNAGTNDYGLPAGHLLIPPRGWLVLENYSAAPSTVPYVAVKRPNATQLGVLTGTADNANGAVSAIPNAPGGRNFVFVPNLDRVYNREFVLARYIKANYITVATTGYTGAVLQYADVPAAALFAPAAPPPAWDIRDFAPLDSFDFTGIDCPLDVVGRESTLPGSELTVSPFKAANWHYHRSSWDTTGGILANKEWRAVYPGRYDASQPWIGSTTPPPTFDTDETGHPRQQGVRRASYDTPLESDPWDPFRVTPPLPPIAMTPNPFVTLGTGANTDPFSQRASYSWVDPEAAGVIKGEFTIPLGSLEAFRQGAGTFTTNSMDWGHWPGINPPIVPAMGTPPANWLNRYPYGGFARNLDALQVPFIGSYWIQHAFDFHDGGDATRPPDNATNLGVGTSILTNTAQPAPWGAASLAVKRMIEINSVTMDSMFAEDTDVANDPTVVQNATPLVADAGINEDTRHSSKEQVGRFAPLRPSNRVGDRVDFPDDPTYRMGTTQARYGDYWEDVPAWRYHWAKRIFEHFTVQSQDEDALAQTNAQAYPFKSATPPPAPPPPQVGFGPRPPESVRNRPTSAAPKYTYAKVTEAAPAGGGTRQIRVTNLPTWVTVGGAITFVGGPHDGQRRTILQINGPTSPSTTPPTYLVSFNSAGTDPRPWDNLAPHNVGDTVRFDSSPEEPTGIEGLVNINTAPARVLATLPWFPAPVGEKVSTTRVKWDLPSKQLLNGAGDDSDDNWDLAQAIAWYRDRDDGRGALSGDPLIGLPGGPFASVFDLYQIPAFKFAQEQLIDKGPAPGVGDVGLLEGDFTFSQATLGVPTFPFSTDGIRFDFKEQYLLLNRVSNLITTRSDVFTIYVVVQGWRDVGLTNKAPQFVAERRDAFIVDRTTVTPNNRKMAEYRLTTD